MGERIAVLYAVLQQHADPLAAASFLALIDDPVVQEGSSAAGSEINWKYAKAAYEKVRSSWSTLDAKVYSADEAHSLVFLQSSPVQQWFGYYTDLGLTMAKDSQLLALAGEKPVQETPKRDIKGLHNTGSESCI